MNKKPNILFINSDSHRYDCIGYANDYPVSTPNLDKLSTQGMSFSKAFTPIPVCAPARQSFFSGVRPETTGGLWNHGITLPIGGLDPKESVWSNLLDGLGYNSAYVGKWPIDPDKSPHDFGYEHFTDNSEYISYIETKHGKMKNPFETKSNNQALNLWGGIDPLPLEDAFTHWRANKTADMIREFAMSDKPWFVHLDMNEPHLPCNPVKEFADLFPKENIPPWRSFKETFEGKPYIQKQQMYNWKIEDLTWEEWSQCVSRYYGMVAQLDDAIGCVLDLVCSLGIEENTIVIYTADHGDMSGGHRLIDKHYNQYDDLIHIPLIIKWKGVIEENAVCDRFVYQYLDLPPTFLELWEQPTAKKLHGRSLLPLLKGEPPVDWREQVMTTFNAAQFGLFTQRALRDEKYKYVWNPTDIDELYDLHSDPDELFNRINDARYAEALKDLRLKLYNELKSVNDKILNGVWLERQLLENVKL